MALGVKEDSRREILGWWLGESEGKSTSIWDEMPQELKERKVLGM